MEKRTWRNSLRDIRFYAFIVTIISFSLIGSLIHSQPASAESFLGKTVRCVVGGLLLGADCRTPAQQTPTPPVTEPQSTSPTSNQNPAPTTTPPQPARPTPSTAVATTQLVPLEAVAEPIVVATELPTLPSAAHRNTTIQAELNNFALASAYTSSGTTLGASTSPFEPSSEGWRIAGVLWYWWMIGIASIFGAGLLIKYRYKTAS